MEEVLLVIIIVMLSGINYQLHTLNRGETYMAATMDDVLASVTAQETIDDSIIAALVVIKARLDAALATGDPVKMQQAIDELATEQQKIVDAVKANTPAVG